MWISFHHLIWNTKVAYFFFANLQLAWEDAFWLFPLSIRKAGNPLHVLQWLWDRRSICRCLMLLQSRQDRTSPNLSILMLQLSRNSVLGKITFMWLFHISEKSVQTVKVNSGITALWFHIQELFHLHNFHLKVKICHFLPLVPGCENPK